MSRTLETLALVVAALVPGLLATGCYELAVRGDAAASLGSVAAACALGACVAAWARRTRRRAR